MPSRYTTRSKTTRIAIALVLATIVVSGLTGCLVKKKDLEKIYRTTDSLRIYKPGDYIIYNVSATRVSNAVGGGIPETLSGTLEIEWKLHNDLTVPFSNTLVPVIQEVTTLNINGGASNQGTVRYISQDADGKVTLLAIEGLGSAADNHFWLNSVGDADLQLIEPFTIFNSPITFGDQMFDGNNKVNFHVMEGCDAPAATSCNSEVGQFNDDHDVVGDSDEITTNLGVFINPFRIDFSGSSTPLSPDFPVVDIRDLCGSTDYPITHTGTMYVLPEVGIIQMQDNCIDSNPNGVSMYYTFTISNTNISLP